MLARLCVRALLRHSSATRGLLRDSSRREFRDNRLASIDLPVLEDEVNEVFHGDDLDFPRRNPPCGEVL